RGELSVARPSHVALLGHSRGGGAAVLAAARLERIAALVTWAAIASVRRWSPAEMARWRERGQVDILNTRTGLSSPIYLEALDDIEANSAGSLDIEAAAARVAVPWLLVHGDADTSVPIEEADLLAEAAGNRSTLQRFTVPGANHTFGAVHPYIGAPAALEQVFDRTVRFLSLAF
ncbi:MAG: prolyl oligopeptidase family serine peptidase, partial [Gemmatimonadales bacterium]